MVKRLSGKKYFAFFSCFLGKKPSSCNYTTERSNILVKMSKNDIDVAKLRNRDDAEWQRMGEILGGYLKKKILEHSLSTDDWEDIRQDVMIAASNQVKPFLNKTWFYSTANNTALYHIRQSRDKRKTDNFEEANYIDPSKQMAQKHDLEQALNKLKPLDKQILLAKTDGYSNKKVAEMLGITERKVEDGFTRSKRIARKHLLGYSFFPLLLTWLTNLFSKKM